MPDQPPTRSQIARIVSAISKGHVPGFGSAQSDDFQVEDNVDATHGLRLPYVIGANFQRIIVAKLTIGLFAYRTYNNFAVGGGTGAGSSHSHSHTHGGHTHSHDHGSHAHTTPITTSTYANAVTTDLNGNLGAGAGPLLPIGGNGATPTTDATSATPTVDATAESTHTHPISSGSNLGVVEGAVATGVSISFDGVDQTTALGGPWNVDQIEMDISSYIATSTGVLHTILLTPSGLGRIHGILRLNYFADASIRA